jgi:asparagine synthase (glutamine-hydrolysing)
VEDQYQFLLKPEQEGFNPAPGSMDKLDAFAFQFVDCLVSNGNRVVLSGIGGDEFLGGVPTLLPEFANLLVSLRIGALFSQLTKWALAKRKPAFSLLFDALRLFCSSPNAHGPSLPCWLTSSFIEQNLHALRNPRHRLKLSGPLPSFQINLQTMESLRRQLALNIRHAQIPCEWAYPYLDRDLLAFLFAIPPQQLLRPGNRRSLMKRSLAGIVPDEILDRKRKAFVERDPALSARSMAAKLLPEIGKMSLVRLNIVSASRLRAELESLRNGSQVPAHLLMRLVVLEQWVRNAERHRVAGLSHKPAKVIAQVSQLRRICNERR